MQKKEREVFGATYDRYVLLQLHSILVQELNLKKVVEMPSHGAKAAGSLYSLGFGKAGSNVTLVNPEEDMLYGWNEVGLQDRVDYNIEESFYKTSFDDNSFDIAWNFVTWTELEDKKRYIEELKRISKKYILLITCNNFQPGYPWHRFLHAWYGFKWNHGDVEYNHITRVKKLFKESGLKIKEYGAIDTPGWPDPSGPRDVRLHRRYTNNTELEKIDNKKKPDWEVPIVEYLKNNSYPGWMKKLGKWDMLFRRGVYKLPMSHLFYVLAEKEN